MPVKPSNLIHYPGGSLKSAEWLAIRNEVLDRDEHRCKICGAPNRASILRVKADDFEHYVLLDTLTAYDASTGAELGRVPADSLPTGRLTRVVLTIAHLDHDPNNNGTPGRRDNLAALCQKDHLHHDREHHAAERAKTSKARKEAQFGPPLPLFG